MQECTGRNLNYSSSFSEVWATCTPRGEFLLHAEKDCMGSFNHKQGLKIVISIQSLPSFRLLLYKSYWSRGKKVFSIWICPERQLLVPSHCMQRWSPAPLLSPGLPSCSAPAKMGCSPLALLLGFILDCQGMKVWWDNGDGCGQIHADWCIPSSPACNALIARCPLGFFYSFIDTHGAAVIYPLTPHVRLCWRAQGVSTMPGMW